MKLAFVRKYLQLMGVYGYLGTALFSIGVLGYVLVGVLLPIYAEKPLWEQQLKSLEQKVEMLEGFASRNSDYENILVKQQGKIAALRKQLPEHMEGAKVISQLHSLAQGSGLRLQINTANNKDAAVRGKQTLCLDLRAFGSYVSMLRFFKALEQESLYSLEELVLDGKGGEELQLHCKCYAFAWHKA